MLDAFAPLDPADFELDALDADLALRPSRDDLATAVPVDDDGLGPDAEQPSRARPGKRNAPRRKGEPLDPERVAAAKVGLPYFARMNWMCCQLLDKGERPTRGHVRWRLKIETCDAAVEHCTRAGLRAMKKERWVWLSKPDAFLDNFHRKAKRFPLLHPARECRPVAEQVARVAAAMDEEHGPLGAPACLLGFVSCRLEGTHTYGGQYCLLSWRRDEEGGPWLPTAVLTQFRPGGEPDAWQERIVAMRVPPAVNRDGAPRNSPFVFVGSWFSDALQERIDTAKAIKAMRAADIARKGGRA